MSSNRQFIHYQGCHNKFIFVIWMTKLPVLYDTITTKISKTYSDLYKTCYNFPKTLMRNNSKDIQDVVTRRICIWNFIVELPSLEDILKCYRHHCFPCFRFLNQNSTLLRPKFWNCTWTMTDLNLQPSIIRMQVDQIGIFFACWPWCPNPGVFHNLSITMFL